MIEPLHSILVNKHERSPLNEHYSEEFHFHANKIKNIDKMVHNVKPIEELNDEESPVYPNQI